MEQILIQNLFKSDEEKLIIIYCSYGQIGILVQFMNPSIQ